MTPRRAADLLRDARRDRRTVEPFTDAHPDLDEDWGYAVQSLARADAVAAGERVVGAKLGLTSAAKQQRMGLDRPIVGFLTDAMLLSPDGVGRALGSWAQPRIEPEIAFVTAHDLDRALAREEVEASIASVGLAAEVIDSRFADYRFRLPDVVADNTSAAGVVLGEQVPFDPRRDLASLGCTVEVDGEVVHRATGAAILGDPLQAVQLLTEHLERHRAHLPAGSLVLAGALTDAVPLLAGRRYRLSVDDLGTIETSPEAPTPLLGSRAEISTSTPERYAKQLVAHLGRKLEFVTDGGTSTTTIGQATGKVVVGDGHLLLLASAEDPEGLGQVEHVLGTHLERFGQRQELVVTWARTSSERRGVTP